MANISTQRRNQRGTKRQRSRGMSLIMVLLILVVVSMLGVGGAQIALMSERGARNDRDQQMAWQAAEAGLIDAENDIWTSTSTRHSVFDGKSTFAFPSTGCGTSGSAKGLCASVSSGKPAWLTANFSDTSSGASTTQFGTFTSANFESGGAGIQPAQKPRYLIEPMVMQSGDASNPEQEVLYRVTAMGFGPRADIQSVVQMLYRL
jgi:type IV pilus assembly protein PilX